MGDSRRFGLTPQLDIGQILSEAKHRWLRPAEICEILRNYQSFRIASEPPNRPPSGSLFLFDRKVLRYFRKDGHSWRKKKDGKTVKEAHEKLKSGSVDVLHCYYAHGEENENLQRRSYWMLEEDLMHIVLVHYREVKGSKASYIRTKGTDENAQVSPMDSPACSNSFTNQSVVPSQVTDIESPNSAHTSEYEEAESDNYQASSRYHSFPEMQQYDDGHVMDVGQLNVYAPDPSLNNLYNQKLQDTGPGSDFYSVAQEDITRAFNESDLGLAFTGSKTLDGLTSWGEILEHCSTGFQSAYFESSVAVTEAAIFDNLKQDSLIPGEPGGNLCANPSEVAIAEDKSFWQLCGVEDGSPFTSNVDVESDLTREENLDFSFVRKEKSLDRLNLEGEGLKKYDSFSRWMSNELGEVIGPDMKSTSGLYWSSIESENVVEDSDTSNQDQLYTYLMSPSISEDQLFSIAEFSPNWAYTGLETKVLITGTFLKTEEDVGKCKWSCMFGEIEVPADLLANGTLCCFAPPHKSGRVPFYITCSDRLACSEVREFEYRDRIIQYMDTSKSYSRRQNEMDLHVRLEKLLSLGSVGVPEPVSSGTEKPHLISKINLLMMEVDDEWFNISKVSPKENSPDTAKDWLLEKLLKEKLHTWLLHKVAEDGKGPSVLDKEGQGVLHLAAALGYDWAFKPTITAGVNINFRDVHGWTALHWAAYCGREETVAALISLGALPGALTDPTPEFPSARTPADLASENGHKGIAGFLAEFSLTTQLETLTLKELRGSEFAETSGVTDIEGVAERVASQLSDENLRDGHSLKDSLSAVRNAAQAAARIHQVFRVQSFQRKKLIEYGDEKCGLSDERALSLISRKLAKPAQHDLPVHAAATRIQNKFRGWKGRKEFLIIRQRIVKIQAHVRGHQVRKHYKKIVWTVGIVEKVILRWRRKGSGLRGFRSEGLIEGPSVQSQPSKEDDYSFLQEGRKQTEARLDKALARVKSMVQYPEARDQYRRLLNVVTDLQESKLMQERILSETEAAADDDIMMELEELWQDDPVMPFT